MKKYIPFLLLLAILLCGCHGENGQTTGQTTTVTEPVPIAYLRDPDNSIEDFTQGAVEAYDLENRSVTGMRFVGGRLMAFTTADHVELTTILVLGGQELGILRSVTLDCGLAPEHLSVSEDGSTLAYYHQLENSLVLLDQDFTELRRIRLPDHITDRPILSRDLSTAYYANGNQIYALELSTGLSRLLKEHTCFAQVLQGLHFNDTVLEVLMTMEDGQTQVAFISPENGETTGTDRDLLTLSTEGNAYLLRRLDGTITETLVGKVGGQLQALDTAKGQTVYPAFSLNALAGVTGTTVSLYDLDSGRITSQLDLGADVLVLEADADPAGNCLWLRVLDQQSGQPLLLRWKIAETQVSSTIRHIHKRYTAQEPDTEGLAATQTKADELAKAYGIHIAVTGDMPAPTGYSYVYEHQTAALEPALERLDSVLRVFPTAFYEGLATVNQTGTIHIGLVRNILDITGAPAGDVGGVHLVSGGDHYFILALGGDLETAARHQLSHVLDSFVFAHNDHYDKWDKCNPKNFVYAGTYDFRADPDEPLLQGQTQRFVSEYGMTYAMEDRATLFTAAMEPGNEALFALEGIQTKLQYMCKAIRNAYGWQETELTLPWEQYLAK